jgi:hypothetical protein
MTIPPSASLENPSLPNAIHTFSSAGSTLSAEFWAPILLACLCVCVLWSSLDLLEPPFGATANAVSCRITRLVLFIHRSVLSCTVGFLAFELTDPRYYPRSLLAALKRSLPFHVIIVNPRQALFIRNALARESEANRRFMHAQLVERLRAFAELRALSVAPTTAGGGASATAAAGTGNAAVPATLPAPSPAAGPAASTVQ